jgi:hypothetical protein
MVVSWLPEASVVPSGLKLSVQTWLVCPSSSSNRPVSRSQIRIAPLQVPDASRFPSGEKATEKTWSSCPRSSRDASVSESKRWITSS